LVSLSKFHKDGPEILGATVPNLVIKANWRPGFVHPCSILYDYDVHTSSSLSVPVACVNTYKSSWTNFVIVRFE